MLKKLLIIPAILLMSQGLFADDHGQAPRRDQPYQDDQYQDQDQGQGGGYGYGGGGGGFGFQGGFGGGCGGGCGGAIIAPPCGVGCGGFVPPPCGGCGGFVPPPCGGCGIAVLPPPPPPPIYYNPGINYYGCGGCAPPVVPYGPPPVAYIPPPGYGRPGYGPPPVVGRPGWGGGRPGFGPRPMPYRHISASGGCAVEQGNNGQFSVISAEGAVLYKSSIQHAEDNAEYMKSYYEKNGDLCGGVLSPAKSLDI